MTLDELIALVATRDRLMHDLTVVNATLEQQRRLSAGYYIASSGDCLKVTTHVDHAPSFTRIVLRQTLEWDR